MKFLFATVFVMVFANVFFHAALWANDFEVFSEGNRALDQGDYEKATMHFDSLLKNYQSADLHHNVGISHFRSGKMGKAVFHFRIAQILSPRDPDVSFNLGYARDKVTTRIEAKESLLKGVLNGCNRLSSKEAMYFLLISGVLLFGISVLVLFKSKEWLVLVRNIFVVLTVFSLIIVGVQIAGHETIGVVVAKESKVYSGVGKEKIVLFTVQEGVEFSLRDTIDADWGRIQLSDGKQGWVKLDTTLIHLERSKSR